MRAPRGGAGRAPSSGRAASAARRTRPRSRRSPTPAPGRPPTGCRRSSRWAWRRSRRRSRARPATVPSTLHSSITIRPSTPLVSTMSLIPITVSPAVVGRDRRQLDHLVAARERPLEPGLEVARVDARQEADPAEVDAEAGHAGAEVAAAARAASCRRRPARRPGRRRLVVDQLDPAARGDRAQPVGGVADPLERPCVITATRASPAASRRCGQRLAISAFDIDSRAPGSPDGRPRRGTRGTRGCPPGPGTRRIAHAQDDGARRRSRMRKDRATPAGAPPGRAPPPRRTARARPRTAASPARSRATRGSAARDRRRQHQPQRDERDVGRDEARAGRAGRPRVSARAFTRSITCTRRVRRAAARAAGFGPRRAAITRAAPCCSRQSVKPPVEAPTSRQRSPVTSTCERRRRRLELVAAARDVARRLARRAMLGVAGDGGAGLVHHRAARPVTRPAMTSACARLRVSASPRSTSSSVQAGAMPHDRRLAAACRSALGQLAELRQAAACASSRARARAIPRQLTGPLEAEQVHVAGLAVDVPSSSTSSTIWNSRPSSAANARYGRCSVRRQPGHAQAAGHRRLDQRAGLEAVQPRQVVVGRRGAAVTSRYCPSIIAATPSDELGQRPPASRRRGSARCRMTRP